MFMLFTWTAGLVPELPLRSAPLQAKTGAPGLADHPLALENRVMHSGEPRLGLPCLLKFRSHSSHLIRQTHGGRDQVI